MGMKYSRTSVFIVVLTLALCPLTMVRAQETVRINEFMAVNDSGLDDEDRDEEDWIEIYNAGADAVEMAGWYLTDNINSLTKWEFPQVTLASGA